MSLREIREKLAARQDQLGKVFTEAKTDKGEYDFRQVKAETIKESLGDNLTTTAQIVEAINAKNAELDALAKEAEGLEAAEKAARDHGEREKARNRPFLPGGDAKGYDRETRNAKSMGQRVIEAKEYQAWVKSGAGGGITLSFDDVLPSDMLAKGAAFETLGSKALMETGAGWAPESIRLPGFVEAAARPIQLLDIIPMSQTGRDAITYMEETTRVHAAAEAAEGGAYAESSFALTERSSPVRKVTDSVPVTDEQLEDEPQTRGYINSRLTFGLRDRLDRQCLVGDATGANLRGLKNTVGIQTQAKGVDPEADAFFKAMTLVRTIGRAVPTHHVIHPTNWQTIRLTRTADGVYIWGNPSEAGPERLWGLPVVQQDADLAGTGYVGSFQPAWLSLFERKGVDIQVGYVGTQFKEGKRTVRGDMRMAFVIFRPGAFCSVTGL